MNGETWTERLEDVLEDIWFDREYQHCSLCYLSGGQHDDDCIIPELLERIAARRLDQ